MNRPRNILLVMVDDLNVALGCMGHRHALTPNIDRLAHRGVLFKYAFTTYPLCGPARTAILTGQRPERIPMGNNEVCWRELSPGRRTLPELARAAGLEAVRFGKIFHHGLPAGPERERLLAAQRLPATYFDPVSWDREEGDFSDDGRVAGREWLFSPTRSGPGGGNALHAIEVDGDGCELPDSVTAERAVRYLESVGDRAFFLGVGFVKPHLPLVAPRPFWEMFPLETLRLPDSADASWERLPRPASFARTPHFGMSRKQQLILLQGYLAATAFMDAQLGRVLDALDASGLTESTRIVFVTDHGFHLGEHGQWNKMTLFEESLHVPLIVAGAGVSHRGAICDELVETLDLFPTVAGWMGRDAGPHDGSSFQSLLENPSATREHMARAWISVPGREGRTVRTRRFRYCEWGHNGADGAQLYDLERDPFELTNRADEIELAGVRRELAELVRAG